MPTSVTSSQVLSVVPDGWVTWTLLYGWCGEPGSRAAFYSLLKRMEVEGSLLSRVVYSAFSDSRKVYFKRTVDVH